MSKYLLITRLNVMNYNRKYASWGKVVTQRFSPLVAEKKKSNEGFFPGEACVARASLNIVCSRLPTCLSFCFLAIEIIDFSDFSDYY